MLFVSLTEKLIWPNTSHHRSPSEEECSWLDDCRKKTFIKDIFHSEQFTDEQMSFSTMTSWWTVLGPGSAMNWLHFDNSKCCSFNIHFAIVLFWVWLWWHWTCRASPDQSSYSIINSYIQWKPNNPPLEYITAFCSNEQNPNYCQS